MTHAEMMQSPRVIALRAKYQKLVTCIEVLEDAEELYATCITVDRVAGRKPDEFDVIIQAALENSLKIIGGRLDGVRWDLDRLLEEAD